MLLKEFADQRPELDRKIIRRACETIKRNKQKYAHNSHLGKIISFFCSFVATYKGQSIYLVDDILIFLKEGGLSADDFIEVFQMIREYLKEISAKKITSFSLIETFFLCSGAGISRVNTIEEDFGFNVSSSIELDEDEQFSVITFILISVLLSAE